MSARFKLNGRLVCQDEVDIMRRMTLVVFEVLEKAWAARGCALIDMKIEFGVDSEGQFNENIAVCIEVPQGSG